jgi:hypothetical protein
LPIAEVSNSVDINILCHLISVVNVHRDQAGVLDLNGTGAASGAGSLRQFITRIFQQFVARSRRAIEIRDHINQEMDSVVERVSSAIRRELRPGEWDCVACGLTSRSTTNNLRAELGSGAMHIGGWAFEMGLWPQGDALPFRKMRRADRQRSRCARLRDAKDCGKLQFARIFTRGFCF